MRIGKKLKKIGTMVFLVCVITACMGYKDAAAAGITDDGLYSYIIRNNKAELTLTGEIFDSESGESPESIIIPGQVDGYDVGSANLRILNTIDYDKIKTHTIIFDSIKLDYNEQSETSSFFMNIPNVLKDNITDIIFNPNCEVSCIPPGYFANYQSLKKINIPHGTKTLGYDAFYYCTSLEEIALPDTLAVFENGCLDTNSSLKTIYYNRKDILDIYTEEQIGIDIQKVDVRERKTIDSIEIFNFFKEVYVDKDYSFSEGYTFKNISVYNNDISDGSRKEITDNLLYSYINNRSVGNAQLAIEGLYEYCGRNRYDFTIYYKEEPVVTSTPAPPVSFTPIPDIPSASGETPAQTYDGNEQEDNAYDDAVISVKKLKGCKMYSYGKKKSYVYLSWYNKNRVGRYVIYRKTVGEKRYKKIRNSKYPDYSQIDKKEFKKKGVYTSFLDLKAKPGKKYKYKIIVTSVDKKRKSKAKYVSVKL